MVRLFSSCVHSIYPPSMYLASFIQGRFIFSTCHKKIKIFISFLWCAVTHFSNSSNFNLWLDIRWLNLLYEVKNLIYVTICLCACCFRFFFLRLEWILLEIKQQRFQKQTEQKSSKTKNWGFIFRNSGKCYQTTWKNGNVMLLAWHILFIGLWKDSVLLQQFYYYCELAFSLLTNCVKFMKLFDKFVCNRNTFNF